MKESELINHVANASGLTKKAVRNVLTALDEVARDELNMGGEIPLPGLGKLVAEHVDAREGRNPATGEALHIPAKTVAKFRPAKALKDALNA